jgi:hypothetical protein
MNILNFYNLDLLMNLSLNYLLQILIVFSSLGFILLPSTTKLGKTKLEHGHKIITGDATSTTLYKNYNAKDGGSDSTPV